MTIRQLIVLLVVLGLVAAFAALSYLRPELVSREHAQQLLQQLKSSLSIEAYLPGKAGKDNRQPALEHQVYTARDIEMATREVLQQKLQEPSPIPAAPGQSDRREILSEEVAPKGKKYLYQLKFANGTGTIAEKVSFGKGTVSYESKGGSG